MDAPAPVDQKKVFLIGGAAVVLVLLVFFFMLLSSKKTTPIIGVKPTGIPADISPLPGNTNPTSITNPGVGGVLVKVGEETIYNTDLNYELTYYPATNPEEARQILTKKMIQDSIILQGAQADGMIKLDATVYNSPNKDYAKRIETVKKLKEQLDQKATLLEGTVIAIWFNNSGPGPIGYDKGKALALSEITKLQKDIKDKKITIQQAGFQIKNNTNLAQVDPSYRANATFDFSVGDNHKITYSPDIDAQIYALNQGDTSPVITGKDRDIKTGQFIDSVYMVAQVSKRATSKVVSYQQWLLEKSSKYAVQK